MSQNIEIEFKNMLTKDEYNLLLHEFHIGKEQIISQENHYFDTSDFALKERGSALRIRLKKNDYEMTLKQPLPVGLLETNQIVASTEALLAIEKGSLPAGKIKKLIEELGVAFSDIKYFGSLLTKRAEISYNEGLLVLDHSFYLNKEDFELEFEAQDYLPGKQSFNLLLKRYQIPERKTVNKIQRFYNQKKILENGN